MRPKSENISGRHSTRSFRSEPISEEILESIISAGLIAPSSKNRQPWMITVVRREKMTMAIDAMANAIENELDSVNDEEYAGDLRSALRTMKILKTVPVCILVGYIDRKPYRNVKNINKNLTDRQLVDYLSIGACIENMALEAEENGIASLWVGDHLYAEDVLRKSLDIEEHIVAILALGYSSKEKPAVRTRSDDRVRYL